MNFKNLSLFRNGITKADLMVEAELTYQDATDVINHLHKEFMIYICDWELSEEKTTWIPVFSLGNKAPAPMPKKEDFKPRRDWATTMLFGDYERLAA
jgi:hypothetical protein